MEFNPGDVISAQVTKADIKQEAGLKLEERHGRYFVRKVDGLFKRRGVPVIAGDQLLKINGREVEDFPNLNAIKLLIKKELCIMVVVLRNDPGDSSESTVEQEEPEVEEEVEYPEEDDEEPLQMLEYQKIEPGDIMMLQGLQAKPGLNGETVKVLREADTPGRWKVKVMETGDVMSVKSENLVAVNNDEEEYEEEGEEEVLWLENGPTPPNQIVNVRDIQPGYKMKLYKLKKKAKMNGTIVKVLKEADTPGRWEVEVSTTKQIMSIAEDNLREF
jgi:hypothetical protein